MKRYYIYSKLNDRPILDQPLQGYTLEEAIKYLNTFKYKEEFYIKGCYI